MEFKPLHYVYKATDVANAYTLLLLHGTGGNERKILPLASSFGSDMNILSFRGNVVENGMRRFFKRNRYGSSDEQDLEFRANELLFFLKELSLTKGFDLTKVIGLGYSNGATMLGAILVLFPDFFAGIILFRPMQPFGFIPNLKNQKTIPLFFSAGKKDDNVEPEETAAFVQILKENHFDVTFADINTGHQLHHKDLELCLE